MKHGIKDEVEGYQKALQVRKLLASFEQIHLQAPFCPQSMSFKAVPKEAQASLFLQANYIVPTFLCYHPLYCKLADTRHLLLDAGSSKAC